MAVTWKRIAYKDEISFLFEVDINGDLEPVTAVVTDQYFEVDALNDIMPKAA